MTREVVSLASDAPLEIAAWRLASEAVSGAPVRDARGNLIGVLSKSDLVDLMLDGSNARVVADAMTPAVWAVHPDAPALDAVKLMVEKHIHRVLVIRGPGRLEGIVSTMDVLYALAAGGEFHPPLSVAQQRFRGGQGAGESDGVERDEEPEALAAPASAERLP